MEIKLMDFLMTLLSGMCVSALVTLTIFVPDLIRDSMVWYLPTFIICHISFIGNMFLIIRKFKI